MRQRLLSATGVTGSLMILLGLVLGIGGVELLRLGGSAYYLVAGIGLLLSGILVIARKRIAFWTYGTVLLVTLLWALFEVGLDGWALVPRLVAPAVLGLWLSMPWVAGRFGVPERAWTVTRWTGAAVCALLIALTFALGWATTAWRWDRHGEIASAAPFTPPTIPVADGDWQYYGRTADGNRYSPLAQITPENVGRLQVAWQFNTGDLPQSGENAHGHEFNFEATPIKIADTTYFCTPHRDIVALDAVTGQQRWRFHPQSDTKPNIYLACRGVAYYQTADASAPCAQRIISTTADARLFALDARTGAICPGFGQNGYVDLRQGMGNVPPGFHFISSQPLVVRGRIMLSGWIYDNQTEGEPSGVIRAFNAVTGKLAWAWDMGRADPTSPLGPNEVFTRGTPNGWGAYTADDKLGMVYVPMGNATPDYWGAHRRPFDEKYSSAIVALDLDTGKERWHFQTVHHDVWDFDLPIAGSLVDLPGGVPALVQTTKRGEIFLLDRRNGQPIAQVTEKSVPQNPLPGDHLSPTQPYSTGMPSLAPKDLIEADMWGTTPIDQMMCRIQFRSMRYDGQFTPPSTQGSIAYPAFDGVMDWQGGTIDPARHLFIANTSYIPFIARATPHDEAIKQGLIKPWAGWESGQPYPQPPEFANGPQYGTLYEVTVKPWLNALGAPCIRPPWGKMVAIDLATRKIVWERPVGTTRDMGLFKKHTDVALPTGIFNIGGNVVTAGGLIFVGAYADDYIRALDEKTGRIVWKARLPAGGQATPSVYQGRDGREYVVIAAGGHGGLGTRNGDAVIAYALPRSRRSPMRGLDFSSWHTLISTMLGLMLFTAIGVGFRLVTMLAIQQRRERSNRQINERLRTLIAAYKVLGGSFTGDLTVGPRHLRDLHRKGEATPTEPMAAIDLSPEKAENSDRARRIRDAVEGALSDIILLGTDEHVRLATQAACELVAGRPVHTQDLVIALRAFIREALDLDPIPEDIAIPMQGPARPGGKDKEKGGGDNKQGGGAGGGMGMGGGGGGRMGGGYGSSSHDQDDEAASHHS